MSENTSPAGAPLDSSNYGEVWKLMAEGWATDFTGYSGRFALPIFLGGEAWVAYERSGEFEVGPLFACIGILYTWSEVDKWMFDGNQNDFDEFRRKLLLHIGMQTNTENFPDLAISASSWVRNTCGIIPSQRVLGGALNVSGAAGIGYDYILDTWLLLETVPEIDQDGACRSILSIGKQVDLNVLVTASDQGQQNVNTAGYVMLGSLLLQGMQSEFKKLFEELSNGIMQAPTLMARLKNAALNESVSIGDLRLFTKNSLV